RDAGLVASAHDCSEGGLAVALLESCITGPDGAAGAAITLEGKGRLDEILFGEAPTRIIVSTPPECLARFERLAAAAGVPLRSLGRVGGERLTISAGGSPVVNLEATPARAAWRGALARHLQG
ncbi:MAG TPA: AIR synthase-related protein, partial [Candidatus Binatia bacterium]|nr:AIR synthase-related protein [Candidatus Binatia bacterium]